MELGGVGKEWGDTCTSMGILIMGTCISCTRTSLHELASQLGLTCNFMQVNNYLPRVRIQAYIHVHVHLVTLVILVILIDVEFHSKLVSVLHIQYTKCTCICMYTWAAFRTEFRNQLLNSRGNFSRKERSTSSYAAHYAVYLAKIGDRFLECYRQTKLLNANNNHDSMHGLHMHHTFLQPYLN